MDAKKSLWPLQWRRQPDALVAMSVLGIVLLLVVPLSPFLLDALLCVSIVLSVITLLLTIYVENPLEFSTFPSLLLFLTLYRLGLNIASTRMILSRAEAGDIIRTFGDFIIQGDWIVGFILFALLTVINFVVVTKGAGRIAEVSARFTLEALPGKQLSIENDISSGVLTLQEAKQFREQVTAEADFYGAMDGASKFVRGDAIASILMIFINLIGGLAIGMTKKKMGIAESFETFTRLTIGDGLVSQIPSLLISVAAGIIVTRAAKGSVGKALPRQLFKNPKVLIMAGGVLLFLALIPGMPFFVMAPMGGLIVLYGYPLLKKQAALASSKAGQEEGDSSIALVHPLHIQLGLQLLELAEPLLQKGTDIRKQIGEKWGIKMPVLHVSDHLPLPPKGYAIKLRGVTVATGRAESLQTLSQKLSEVIESHLHELINRQDVVKMIEIAKLDDAAVVEELIPDRLKPGQILRIMQNLLKERIPVRDFVAILELIADHLLLKGEVDIDLLTEAVRLGLSRGISEHFFGEKKVAYAITFDPKVEQALQAAFQKGEQGNQLLLRPATMQKIRGSLQHLMEKAKAEGMKPVVLTHPMARRALRQVVEKELPSLPILSFGEVVSEVEVRMLGLISTDVLM